MKKIIIIGSGILGAATAYELAKQDVAVTVIDNHAKGRATSAAAGIICPWLSKRRNKDWYALAANGAAHYDTFIPELEKQNEKDTGYKKVGTIRLHHDLDNLEELQELAIRRRVDAPEIGEIKILGKQETKTMFPLLNEEYYSLYIEGAARVDGNKLREAFIRSAQKLGAQIIKGEAKLSYKENQIIGVKIDGNHMEADQVIAANGVWMNELLAPLQLDLQFQAQKGEIVHMQMDEMQKNDVPVVKPPNNQYILQFDDGRIVAGATHEKTQHLNPELSAGGMHYLLDEALKMAPGLEKASILETRVGFRPFTYNHLPVFGPIPNFGGLMIANGLGASGLTTGPYIGKQLAKMVTGQEPDLDITAYKIELGRH